MAGSMESAFCEFDWFRFTFSSRASGGRARSEQASYATSAGRWLAGLIRD